MQNYNFFHFSLSGLKSYLSITNFLFTFVEQNDTILIHIFLIMDQYNQNPQNGNAPYGDGPHFPNPTSYIGFIEAIKICFTKYADFTGRATRAEYWWFWLFTFLVSLALGFIPFIGWAISIATLIPSLAVAWRRLHDTGRAGGWFFISLIPLVGTIILIVWLCKPSEPAPNRFGPMPE